MIIYLIIFIRYVLLLTMRQNMICALNTSLKWLRLPCFGHNLNLAITNSIKDDSQVARALGICRKSVSLLL